ncbi:MAG: S41 family peptidase [Blastocatellales bacterium]
MTRRVMPGSFHRGFEITITWFLVITITGAGVIGAHQSKSNFTRDHAKLVLRTIRDDVKKNYYDPNFHGIDLDARFTAAEEKLASAESTGQLMGIIAQVLLDFDDSHLFFLPPGRMSKIDYGWEMRAVGDKVYVTAVKPGSDAEDKGLKTGDRVVEVGGFEPTRENLWKLNYLFRSLRPQPGLRVILESPDGKRRQLDLMANVRRGKQIMDLTSSVDYGDYIREMEDDDRLDRSRLAEFGEELIIWKMPTFSIDTSHLSSAIGKIKNHKNVIIDLRGNGGGLVDICSRMVGAFFEQEFEIAQYKGRKEMKPMKSRNTGDRYTGKVIVLIDSRSASASEIFARTIQLEKRGIVIGDRSAGAVMRSRRYSHEIGFDTIIPYGVSVTDADVIMKDGRSLEKTGVTPDELLLPTAADMAAGRDPVLARAAELAGVRLDPQKAGSLFPLEWRK